MRAREALDDWLDRTEDMVSPDVFDEIRRSAVDRLFANPSVDPDINPMRPSWDSGYGSLVLDQAREDARLNPINERRGPPTRLIVGAVIDALRGPRFREYRSGDPHMPVLLWGGPAHNKPVVIDEPLPYIELVVSSPINLTRVPEPLTDISSFSCENVRYVRTDLDLTGTIMGQVPSLNRSLFTHLSGRDIYRVAIYTYGIDEYT